MIDNNIYPRVCAPEIIIRCAVPSDYGAVSRLEEIEFSAHRKARPDYFKDPKISYPEQEFSELLGHPSPIALVAEADSQIVGLCFGRIEASRESTVCRSRLVAFIEDVVTLPKFRGRGIAGALLSAAREKAEKSGADAVELCVWDFNKDALGLYKKLGFKVQYYRLEQSLSDLC